MKDLVVGNIFVRRVDDAMPAIFIAAAAIHPYSVVIVYLCSSSIRPICGKSEKMHHGLMMMIH